MQFGVLSSIQAKTPGVFNSGYYSEVYYSIRAQTSGPFNSGYYPLKSVTVSRLKPLDLLMQATIL
jgi:hypothetical protein